MDGIIKNCHGTVFLFFPLFSQMNSDVLKYSSFQNKIQSEEAINFNISSTFLLCSSLFCNVYVLFFMQNVLSPVVLFQCYVVPLWVARLSPLPCVFLQQEGYSGFHREQQSLREENGINLNVASLLMLYVLQTLWYRTIHKVRNANLCFKCLDYGVKWTIYNHKSNKRNSF